MWTSRTGMTDIGTLGRAYAQAYAINKAGYVTGASQTQGMGPMVTTHAFSYQLRLPNARFNRMVDLGVRVVFPVMARPLTITTIS